MQMCGQSAERKWRDACMPATFRRNRDAKEAHNCDILINALLCATLNSIPFSATKTVHAELRTWRRLKRRRKPP